MSGRRVRLVPLPAAGLEDYLIGLADPETCRLTGTRATFERPEIERWLATRQDHDDRADWAAVRIADGRFVGEAVINEFDPDNSSANYRVWLAGPDVIGRGYGTEITRLVVDYVLDVVGLHRLSLGVYEFNRRAYRVYEKCGFRLEGRVRDALRWNGSWHDELIMAVLDRDPRSIG